MPQELTRANSNAISAMEQGTQEKLASKSLVIQNGGERGREKVEEVNLFLPLLMLIVHLY